MINCAKCGVCISYDSSNLSHICDACSDAHLSPEDIEKIVNLVVERLKNANKAMVAE